MTTTADRTLASHVVLRLDRDPDVCAAWIDSADRVCGKPAAAPWLCPRHVKVAQKRAGKLDETPAKADASTADWYATQISATRRRIARQEATIKSFESRTEECTDPAMVNIPLRKRQRGLESDLAAHRAYRAAVSGLPGSRARLAWLEERNPE